ncbi:hypothetical protein Ssi02_33710 [Sinosporangium siamense]|uniref:Uncharacterized protein n=1 Tax=Sinosporangium siamense TaxID=1367973 RepID=A0A919RHY1_9ACTN|nr:hypothetical protein Ssi02_33710 [Sinosporangium siamense]
MVTDWWARARLASVCGVGVLTLTSGGGAVHAVANAGAEPTPGVFVYGAPASSAFSGLGSPVPSATGSSAGELPAGVPSREARSGEPGCAWVPRRERRVSEGVAGWCSPVVGDLGGAAGARRVHGGTSSGGRAGGSEPVDPAGAGADLTASGARVPQAAAGLRPGVERQVGAAPRPTAVDASAGPPGNGPQGSAREPGGSVGPAGEAGSGAALGFGVGGEGVGGSAGAGVGGGVRPGSAGVVIAPGVAGGVPGHVGSTPGAGSASGQAGVRPGGEIGATRDSRPADRAHAVPDAASNAAAPKPVAPNPAPPNPAPPNAAAPNAAAPAPAAQVPGALPPGAQVPGAVPPGADIGAGLSPEGMAGMLGFGEPAVRLPEATPGPDLGVSGREPLGAPWPRAVAIGKRQVRAEPERPLTGVVGWLFAVGAVGGLTGLLWAQSVIRRRHTLTRI